MDKITARVQKQYRQIINSIAVHPALKAIVFPGFSYLPFCFDFTPTIGHFKSALDGLHLKDNNRVRSLILLSSRSSTYLVDKALQKVKKAIQEKE